MPSEQKGAYGGHLALFHGNPSGSTRVISGPTWRFEGRPVVASSMSFDAEAELAGPVARWLEEAGFEVQAEVPILGRRADLVGLRPDALAAVELKMRDWRRAFRQALSYQLGTDYAWIAMPLAAASRAYRERWRFEDERIGLMAIDDRGGVRVPIAAVASPRLLPFLRTTILDLCQGTLDADSGDAETALDDAEIGTPGEGEDWGLISFSPRQGVRSPCVKSFRNRTF
jgi:hypothetical protein